MTCTDGGASSEVVSDVLIAREFRTVRDIEFGRTTLRGAKCVKGWRANMM